MKWIKIYDAFKSSNEYYTEIDERMPRSQVRFRVKGETSNENDPEVEYFKSLKEYDIHFSTEDGPLIYLIRYGVHSTGRDNEVVYILKCLDEWYYLHAYGKFGKITFRCDQFEGLKKLIEDLFEIN